LPVLKDVSFTLNRGESLALVGPSGSGKSTLLHMLGLLDTPTSGEIILNGKYVQGLSETAKTLLRRQFLGFVYQFHHLLPELTALENVILPQRIQKRSWLKAEAKAKDLLEQVGLQNRLKHLPSALSGGERQRLAIARALSTDPQLLLADEPTGSLDTQTAQDVFTHLLDLVTERKVSLVVATHNPLFAKQLQKSLTLGKIA
jgi:lipoprotein-releasing system ATP-binding protein